MHQLKTSRGIVEYVDVGSGIPTLYFHGTGAGCDAAVLLEQPLVHSGCRLIVPNRSGYYGTALMNHGAVEPCVVQAAELLDHLAIRQAVVIGTSGGGMPAARFAEKYPERSASLILQCCQSHQWDSPEWLPVSLRATLFLFRYSMFRPFLRWESRRRAKVAYRDPKVCLKNMSGSRFPEIADDDDVMRRIARLAKMTLECTKQLDGVQNDWAILVGDNGLQKGMVKCSTMIIHDRDDPLVPFLHAEWSHACIPHAELLDVHAGGHLIWFGKDFPSMHQRRVDLK
jgi:pimeloyl-ACP methyl ester carboxylesterase